MYGGCSRLTGPIDGPCCTWSHTCDLLHAGGDVFRRRVDHLVRANRLQLLKVRLVAHLVDNDNRSCALGEGGEDAELWPHALHRDFVQRRHAKRSRCISGFTVGRSFARHSALSRRFAVV